MKSFSSYIKESSKEITIVRGSFNPPIAAHEKLFETAYKVSSGGKYRIHSTHLNNDTDQPLLYEKKIKYMRKMFPRHARSIVMDSHNSIQAVMSELYDQGYNRVNIVVEENKVISTEKILEKYNGVKTRHGFYNFPNGINVISAGTINVPTNIISESVTENDYQQFCKLLPSSFKESKEMFNDIRKGMCLQEVKDFRTHVHLESVSDTREAYIAGALFNVGDSVVVKESDEVGQVIMLGSNYVLVEMSDGKKVRKWLEAVEKLDINEDWFSSLLAKASKITGKGAYSAAANTLQKVIDRKKNQGDLRHPVEYYAAQIAKQFRGNIDPRELAKMVESVENLDEVGEVKTADFKVSPTTGRKVRTGTIRFKHQDAPTVKTEKEQNVESFTSFSTYIRRGK